MAAQCNRCIVEARSEQKRLKLTMSEQKEDVVYVWVTKGTSIERVCVCHVNVNHYKYRH